MLPYSIRIATPFYFLPYFSEQLWINTYALSDAGYAALALERRSAARRDEIIDGTLHAVGWRVDNHEQIALRRSYATQVPAALPLTNIQWLHIPKTGTSFIGTLWMYACGRSNPPIDIAVDAWASSGCRACYDFALMDRYPEDQYCTPGVLHRRFQTQHWGLNKSELDAGTNYVGFFRKPSQRIMSALKANRHTSGFSKATSSDLQQKCGKDAGCFARFPGVAGCMTRMLVGGSCAADPRSHSDEDLSAKADVPTAINHLHRMAFVGLTDRWDESVCLFHLMYGQRLDANEFKDEHHSKFRHFTSSLWNETELDGFVDEADEQIYAAAVKRFNELVHRHTAGRGSACEFLGWTSERQGSQVSMFSSDLQQVASGPCSTEGAECGRTADADCGVCPRERLSFRGLQEGVQQPLCSSKNKCVINGKADHDLYQWTIDRTVFKASHNRTRLKPPSQMHIRVTM